MRYPLALLGFFVLLTVASPAQPIDVAVTIDMASARHPINPMIYGLNAYVYDSEWTSPNEWRTGLDNHEPGLNVGLRRLGGNTMTSYNWENGFSNSGNDDNHSNNTFQSFITGAGDAPYMPGEAITTFHDHSMQVGAASLLQLPAAGYVAADANGAVSEADIAPSSRWKRVVMDKGSPLLLMPDLADNAIYVDEEIAFLLNRYGPASSATGISAYELDNEPGLWHHYPSAGAGGEGTHSRLHPAMTTCAEILERSIGLARTIRRMDPSAAIVGPAMWGYVEFYSLWNVYDGGSHTPSDWGMYNVEPYTTNNTGDPYRYNHMTWANAWLDGMRIASADAGMRLVDNFSVHYYPTDEAIANDDLRMQAPRSLWDTEYVEPGWITKQGNGFTDGRPLALLPTLRRSVDDFYPGTGLAITEYSFGGRHNISGGIAQADALGIFGSQNVAMANYFFTVDDYIAAAFRLYRNYNGMNGTFGDTSLPCSISDRTAGSAWASIDTAGRLHLILLNKERTRELATSISFGAYGISQRGEVWGFDNSSTTIRRLADIDVNDATISYTIPPLNAVHIIFSPATSMGIDNESPTKDKPEGEGEHLDLARTEDIIP